MKVYACGTDKRTVECGRLLSAESFPGIERAVLLPIPTTRDGVHVLGTEITLEELSGKLRPFDLLVGYGVPRELREAAAGVGCAVADVSVDEEFLAQNAALTAVGAVARLCGGGELAPKDQTFGIIGYGRIGERLTHILMFLGARVKVFTSKKEVRDRLGMLGVCGVDYYSDLEMAKALSDVDVLVNTAPARIVDDECANILSKKRVVELASGDNFPSSLPVERMPSIPAIDFPKSAAIALADSVKRLAAAT